MGYPKGRWKTGEQDVWPVGFDLAKGFSDAQLRELCSEQFGRIEANGFGFSPWLHWPSELYSHGRCIREWIGWPRGLPIPAFSDHGVEHFEELHGPELSTKAKLYLTWSDWRKNPSNRGGKLILSIPHPWVTFRRKMGIVPKPGAQGLVVFIPHDLPGHSYAEYDWDSYFGMLNQTVGRPDALMLSMHDVRLGKTRELRRFGIPLLSAGNTESPYFVERFYSIISNFAYATSPERGTQTYICEEMGVTYYLLGAERDFPESITTRKPIAPTIAAEADSIFRFGSDSSKKTRLEFVARALNSESDSPRLRRTVRMYFILYFFHAIFFKLIELVAKARTNRPRASQFKA